MKNIEKVVDFVISNTVYSDRDTVRKYLELHEKYKTLLVIYDRNDLPVAVCRWNIEGMDTAHVLDLIIRKQFRNIGLIKWLLEKGLNMYPSIKYIKFERELKYPGMKTKVYSVDRILKRHLQEVNNG